MRFTTILPVLLAAGFANAQAAKGKGTAKGGQQAAAAAATANNNNNNNNNNNGGGGNAGNALTLLAANVQKNSNTDGLAQAEAGQAASATDPANFINFCSNKQITNGLQVKGGSCNGIPMGDIPASTAMVSAVMLNPTNGQTIQQNTAINFQVKIANLAAGTFTNPDTTYYAAPQGLKAGKIVGHTHITVQDLGNNANPTQPLDAQTFAFFKGINDAGDGQGTLSAALAAGLPAGNYRVCSMTSAANHQPVLMPVAQRGPQDDCVRFTVAANGGGNNNNANAGGNAKGKANAGAAAGGAAQGQQAAQGQGQQAQQGAAAKGKGRGRGRFSARDFIA